LKRSLALSIASGLLAALALPAGLAGQGVFKPDTPKQPGAKTWLARKAALPPYHPPRTADGQPNLQGSWGNGYSGDVIEETEYVDRTTPPVESWIADPPDGKIPYQPWALAARDAHRAGLARGWPGENGQHLYADPQTFCLESVPRYSERGFELVQSRDSVTMISAWGHLYRVIPLDGRPAPGPAFKSYMGVARGHWDGETLVIDVTNINGKMWLDSVGNFYGESAHLTERFRLADANTLDYELTVDDPATFTRPWKADFPIRRARASDDPYAAELWEQTCYEGDEHHIDGIKSLGFKWYFGEKPPAAK
jgi:hypothetical protein